MLLQNVQFVGALMPPAACMYGVYWTDFDALYQPQMAAHARYMYAMALLATTHM